MEIIGTTLSVARNLAEALQCWEFISDKFSVFSYESELHDLQQTVEKISAVLRDAETKQELSHEAKVVIEALKDAIFEADDLVDEIVTRAHQQKQVDADGTLFEKVSHFFSTSNPICVSYWMSGGIKDIKKKLDAIAYNNQFSINHDPQPIRTRSRDTCSYVNQVDIVGRGDDLEKIVGMLLHPADDQRHNVSFLSVVGIGGLGKTALAQLVFNDPRVKSAFSWTNWTCVADQDQKELDVKEVLCKILERKGSTLEQVQSQLRENLAGKRYFLVLDDVWTESRKQWCDLVKYLIGGQRGSWIVVTTRSHKTAEIVGGQVHKLQGLSEENSWSLFQQSAFTSNPPDELVKIGRKIVDKCAGVPLAIKVVGSFLYGQDRGKWKFVQEKGLANIRQSDNGILSILKLSFHHLEAPLKSCFAYCALFPKDYEMNTEKLKSLWMAQGYVVPLDEGQSIEDACEEYFSILLRRCFFQDIRKDYYGEIRSCKIHDLMHDIALDVSGKEIFCATNTIGGNLDKKVRHLFCERFETMRERGNYSLFGKSRIRSYLLSYILTKEYTQFPVDAIVANYRFLRALDLSWFGIKSLSGCMGELLHLRYLDLSHNKDLHELPKSFTKLYNLQTLKLRRCENLTELPKDFSRLVKLRLLDVMDCESLRYMPKGIGKLSCLHWLSDFMVGGGGSSPSWKQWFDSLEDLKALNKLKGRLEIEIRWAKRDRNIIKEDGDKREGLYMRNKEHLNELRVYFIHEEGDDGGKDEELSLMEDLQPHSNLEYLAVENYRGVKMPGWLTLIKNMVSLELNDCGELGYLPCLGNLRNLKSIKLHNLAELEYIGVDDSSWANSNTTMPMSGLGSSDKELSFFPSLKEVELFLLPKLKGWKRGVVGRVEDNILQSQQLLPCFSKLQTLEMYFCLELTCLPSCPDLESLSLIKFNEGLQIMNKKRDEVTPASSSASTSGYEIVNPKLQTLQIDNMAWPNSLPSGYLHRVSSLELWEVEKVDTLNWMLFLPALQTLEIRRCRQMKAIPKWMPKLTSLTTLRFRGNSESLKRRCKKDPPGEDWPYIQHIPNIEFDGSGSEMHASWGDDGKQQSHRLPLPPVTIPSPSPFSHGNSAATSPSVPRSPARGENLPSPTSRWKKGRLLGRGTFGHVYLGFNSETGEMCAMKEVTLFSDDPKSKESAKQLQQEIALLGRLRHPNIVQYYGSETVEDKLYIYLEFVSGGSIYKLLQEYGQLGELAIRSYTQQILSGLAFLHGKNTVHRDIKGANILVDPNGRVKLADFGMAKHITGQSCPLSFKGSPYWMAPEVIQNSNGCNLAVDIWSLGITVLEMATTKPPWSQYEGVAAMFKIGFSKELPAIPDHLSDEGKDFVKLCLQRDPQQRCTAAQLLEHPFVKNTAPLERPIPSPEPTDTPISASNGMRSLGVGLERNLSSLDSESFAVHSSRVSPARPHSSEYHIPRSISCPVSPIGSPLLHPRSPQHLNGMMSPSPISSPRTTSGS